MWQRVRRSSPCPICQRDHYCTVNVDRGLVRCTRSESDRPSLDSHGGIAWIHRMGTRPDYIPPPAKEPASKIPLDEIERLARDMQTNPRAAAKRNSESELLAVAPWSLVALGVGIGWSYDGQEYSSWPSRDGRNRIVGITRRFANGRKLTFRGTSNRGLFIPAHANARYWHAVQSLWVVEGASDVAMAISCGVPAIGRPSNSGGSLLLAKWIPRHCPNIRQVIVWGENDYRTPCPMQCTQQHCHACFPGLYGAQHVTADLKRRMRVEVIRRMPSAGAKDVRHMLTQDCLSCLPCHECRIYPSDFHGIQQKTGDACE